MATLVFNGDTSDSSIVNQQSTISWNTCMNGAINGTLALSGSDLYVNETFTTLSSSYTADQAFISFNTSTIGTSTTVSSASLTTLCVNDQTTNNITMEASVYDWGTSVTLTDFRNSAQLAALTVSFTYTFAGSSKTGTTLSWTSTGSAASQVVKTGSTR